MAESRIPASPLSVGSVIEALDAASVQIPIPTVLTVTDSTNDEALTLANDGAPAWSVVVADQQRSGRGRLGRAWETPPGQALLFSTVLRPPTEWAATAWGWIPLIAGIAVRTAIAEHCLAAALKWPNDVVVDGSAYDGSAGPRKLAGILAERRGSAVVVGVGINVAHTQEELPIPAATSISIEGGSVSREVLLASTLGTWIPMWEQFIQGGGDAETTGIRAGYASMSATLGRRVRVEVAGNELVGEATEIDGDGHLVVDGVFGRQSVSAGDVTHLRPA
ncbi:MAG: biotin--[acetyl-CoA-carboxylase] ligase [Candidatus Nanopelagicales bacterium]